VCFGSHWAHRQVHITSYNEIILWIIEIKFAKFIRHVWCLHHLPNLCTIQPGLWRLYVCSLHFFPPIISTIQLSKTTCKSSNYIGMCNVKNTTFNAKHLLQTRWIKKQDITFQNVINHYKQCSINWVARYPKTYAPYCAVFWAAHDMYVQIASICFQNLIGFQNYYMHNKF
jgi:hypothetical protein